MSYSIRLNVMMPSEMFERILPYGEPSQALRKAFGVNTMDEIFLGKTGEELYPLVVQAVKNATDPWLRTILADLLWACAKWPDGVWECD